MTDTGTVKLVGTDPDVLYRETITLLDDSDEYNRMAHSHNPYGDGEAANRILEAIT